MKALLPIVFFMLHNFATAQTLPMLTKAQMYADFDTLTMALTQINPHDFVRRSVNNYAQSDSILALRKQIDTMSSTASFFWLVNKALTFCQDGHTSIMRKRNYRFVDSIDRLKWHSTPDDTLAIDAYYKLYTTTMNSYRLKLPIKYINGAYTVSAAFEYQNIKIPSNAILTQCDSKDIYAYVNTLMGTCEEMHWDFELKRFYSEEFTQSINHKPTDKIALTFKANGREITHKFALNDTIRVKTPLKYKQDYTPSVHYFEEGKILYFHMPAMQDGDYYLRKIDSIGAVHTFKKVIFDIRDNPGGSDLEWQNIIRHLIDTPIVRNIIRGANRKNPRRNRFELTTPLSILKPDFIKEDFYEAIDYGLDTLEVDTNSLRFKGNIYVLQNENCFSSAGSLISTCQFSDKLINVGNSTGWFAGFGVMPWIMILPHSKILYWTEPLLDFTNAKKPEDLFQNRMKIPIKLTAEDYTRKYTYPNDWYSKEYLFQYDTVFKAVLGMKE